MIRTVINGKGDRFIRSALRAKTNLSPFSFFFKSCSERGVAEMTIVCDLYGAEKTCLLSARSDLERALGETFEERDSSYQSGIYYMWGRGDSENFVLKLNIDTFDGGSVEQNCASYKVLLYVNATNRSSDIEKMISQGSGFKLLRHEVL